MTDRKPALKQYTDFENGGKVILASDIPAAILNATKAELAALAVFAEAMPELLEAAHGHAEVMTGLLERYMSAALAAAKSTTAEEA